MKRAIRAGFIVLLAAATSANAANFPRPISELFAQVQAEILDACPVPNFVTFPDGDGVYEHDMDNDGNPDLLVNWSDMICNLKDTENQRDVSTWALGKCGSNLCNFSVYLSSKHYTDAFQKHEGIRTGLGEGVDGNINGNHFFGQEVFPHTRRDGLTEIMFRVGHASCSDLDAHPDCLFALVLHPDGTIKGAYANHSEWNER